MHQVILVNLAFGEFEVLDVMYNLFAKLVERRRRAVYSKALPAECRETTPFLDSPDSTDRNLASIFLWGKINRFALNFFSNFALYKRYQPLKFKIFNFLSS